MCFSIMPYFEIGQRPFFEYRQEFYKAIAKARLFNHQNDDDWTYCDYNSLLDWAMYTLIFQSMGPGAQKALLNNKLNPAKHLKHTNIDEYLRTMTVLFDGPADIVEYDESSIDSIQYLFFEN